MFCFFKRPSKIENDKYPEQVAVDHSNNDKDTVAKSFENHLKLTYDSLRKDFDIVLSNIMPMQKNLIKTYLWLNFSVIGACFILLKEYSKDYPILIIGYGVVGYFCIRSIYQLIRSLFYNEPKSFIDYDLEKINCAKQYKYTYIQSIINLSKSTKQALDNNKAIVEFRAKLINVGAKFLFKGCVSLVICFGILIVMVSKDSVDDFFQSTGKEVIYMADEEDKIPTQADDCQPAVSKLQTNNYQGNNESYDSGFNITSSDQNQTDTTTAGNKDKE
ncbi:hypothetical protein [Campylobacter sp. RM16191]|uniref:hypothetical protein n=1 Tax=Campylobacter sp. RM16191 TaxID=1705728 RepID=UPI0014766E87|nr:hypothetical protein [Campylobacter sp. RM16191]